MVSGWPLAVILTVLFVWLCVLCFTLLSVAKRTVLPRNKRETAALAGLACSALAVTALLAINLSWITPSVSQWLGNAGIRVFGFLLVFSAVAGLFLNTFGVGRVRVFGILTCIIAGLGWFTLAMSAAISMGGVTARHPMKFLIPKGYVGWATIKFGQAGAPLPISNGEYICKIPASRTLVTSSAIEMGWAKDEYLYYSADNSFEQIAETGWGEGGKIWGEMVSSISAPENPHAKQFTQSFYVGSEDQYKRDEGSAVSSSLPR